MSYKDSTTRWKVTVSRSKGFKTKKKPASKIFTNKENAIDYFKSINQLWFYVEVCEYELNRVSRV